MGKSITNSPDFNSLLAHVSAEAEVRSPNSTAIVRSVCRGFLELNEVALDSMVTHAWIDKLRAELDRTSTNTLRWPANADSAYRSRVRSLVRAYDQLTGLNFYSLVREKFTSCGKTHAEIAGAAGMSENLLKAILTRSRVELSAEAAKGLDKALEGDGAILGAYTGMLPQECAARGLLLVGPQWGGLIRDARVAAGLTMTDLAQKLGIRSSTLSSYERGMSTPCAEKRDLVTKLDEFLGAEGRLLGAWQRSNPTRRRTAYGIPFRDWPERARKELARLTSYKTTNVEELPRQEGQQWGEDSNSMFARNTCRFFGYVLDHTPVTKDQLSLNLLCDWALVKGWLSYVNVASGRPEHQYVYWQAAYVQVLKSLWGSWFPHFFEQDLAAALADPYWGPKLPTHHKVTTVITRGITRQVSYELQGIERWCSILAVATEKANTFLRGTRFEKGNLVGRAKEFIDAKIELAQVGIALRNAVDRLPVENPMTPRHAVNVRRLAIACILAVRPFRKGTLARIKTDMVRVSEDGVVSLDLPKHVFKNKKAVKGPLPAVPWLHRAVASWIKSERAVLVGDAEDECYLFTARGGRKVSHNLIYNDTRFVLGAGPHAMRYIFATDGHRHKLSDQEIADVLLHDVEMTRHHYKQSDAEDHNMVANDTAANLLMRSTGAHR